MNTALVSEILLIGFLVWVAVTKIDLAIVRSKEQQYKRLYLFTMLFDQIAVLPYIIGAIVIYVLVKAVFTG